jgi:phospholipase C
MTRAPIEPAPIQRAPVQHVVVLMMENACFDRMLGCMAATRPGLEGVDPAAPRTNPDGVGGSLAQRETTSRNIVRDPRHYLPNAMAQYAGGTNQGFVTDFINTHPNSSAEQRSEVMAYYPRGFLPGLHTLADHFVICDHWFSSLPGPTWMNRLFAHSGTSLGQTDEPGAMFNSARHVYPERTLYDELTDNKISWRIYFGDVPQSIVMTHQLRHLRNYRRYAHFCDDVAKGDLPAYCFIEPTYFGPHQNDQHPPHDIMRGDALIASVYNALRANAALFEKTLLIVLYDEHGGFFDHVVPPATVAPDAHTEHFAFDVLGFRVPAILTSPLLDPGINKAVFDHTSLLRMAANLWPGVQPLGARAAQANDPLQGLPWRATPRTDLPEAPVAPDIQAAWPMPRLDGFKASLFGLAHHLESLIVHEPTRHGLMQRAHEGLGGAMDQAKLATDRFDAFCAQHSPGWLRRLADAARRRLGW